MTTVTWGAACPQHPDSPREYGVQGPGSGSRATGAPGSA